MRLFSISGRLSSSKQIVSGQPIATLPDGMRKDPTEVFQVRGGRFSFVTPAFDERCALVKTARAFCGVISNAEVTELTDRAFHPARWDEHEQRFARKLPSYCDSVILNGHEHMNAVRRRLNLPMPKNAYTIGREIGAGAYNKRRKLAPQLKAALKAYKGNREEFSRGFTDGWNHHATPNAVNANFFQTNAVN